MTTEILLYSLLAAIVGNVVYYTLRYLCNKYEQRFLKEITKDD